MFFFNYLFRLHPIIIWPTWRLFLQRHVPVHANIRVVHKKDTYEIQQISAYEINVGGFLVSSTS